MKRKLNGLLLIAVLLLSGCLSRPQAEPPAPPQPAVTPVAVYYSDSQAQYLVPEWREVAGDDLATGAIGFLSQAPGGRGLSQPLPATVELLRPVWVEGGVAMVDLNKAFSEIQGSTGSLMAVESIVYTLTDLPGIDKVQFLVEGSRTAAIHGRSLEKAVDRGSIHTYPVFVDAERVQSLQAAADEGREPWRLEAREVLEFEGRMFGFTAAELQAATLEGGLAQVKRGEQVYTITLEQKATKGEKGIWTITGIEQHK